MLDYNDIASGKFIVLFGEPYEVLSAQTSKRGRGQASNQTKLKNLVSGKVIDRTFHQADTVKEADIEKRTIQFLFHHPKKDEYWFCEPGNRKERFQLPHHVVGDTLRLVEEHQELEALVFNDGDEEQIVALTPPIKVELAVTETPPGVKGDTAQGGTKQATLSTGATITVPLFVNEGDIVRVNTQTGEYAERVKKSG